MRRARAPTAASPLEKEQKGWRRLLCARQLHARAWRPPLQLGRRCASAIAWTCAVPDMALQQRSAIASAKPKCRQDLPCAASTDPWNALVPLHPKASASQPRQQQQSRFTGSTDAARPCAGPCCDANTQRTGGGTHIRLPAARPSACLHSANEAMSFWLSDAARSGQICVRQVTRVAGLGSGQPTATSEPSRSLHSDAVVTSPS